MPTLQYLAEIEIQKKQLEEKNAEIAALRDKLSDMIIICGQALACSPCVKTAYEELSKDVAALKEALKEVKYWNTYYHQTVNELVRKKR